MLRRLTILRPPPGWPPSFSQAPLPDHATINVLMIGALPPPVGGARVSFQHIVEELRTRPGVNVSVIPTWPAGHGLLRKLLPACRVTLLTLLKARHASVIAFFGAAGGIILWAPVLHVIARLFGKPWILRAFGGGFDLAYARLPAAVQAYVRRTSLSADLVLFQTPHLVHHFSSISPRNNVFWHANFRPVGPRSATASHEFCRRFVFLGHVKPSKGITDVLHASELLTDDVEIHIFGPLQDGLREADFRIYHRVTYRGVLPRHQVVSTLRGCHALLLPTRYADEGLPGVILEAYSVGIPVIASRWSAIPEIVDHTCGILVTPGDPLDLARAMQRLVDDAPLYRALSRGTWRQARQFSLRRWTDIFVSYCHAALSHPGSTKPVACGQTHLLGIGRASPDVAHHAQPLPGSDERRAGPSRRSGRCSVSRKLMERHPPSRI